LSGVPLGPARLGALHAADLPQKDELCGAFWGSLALRALGVESAGGEPVDQDAVALAAGTTRSSGDPAQWVPPGATPRGDHRIRLPLAEDDATAGTAAPAVAAAVERLSNGAIRAIPVAGAPVGGWSAESVVRLLELLEPLGERVVAVANLSTAPLWGSRADPASLLAVLAGEAVQAPPPDWHVGHFVGLALLVRGPGGALVLIRDTYRELGVDGHHLQPAAALAAALERGDGVEGGVLCFVPAHEADGLRGRLEQHGFELRHWDNGSVPAAAT
jgi:hypothetical protein